MQNNVPFFATRLTAKNINKINSLSKMSKPKKRSCRRKEAVFAGNRREAGRDKAEQTSDGAAGLHKKTPFGEKGVFRVSVIYSQAYSPSQDRRLGFLPRLRQYDLE